MHRLIAKRLGAGNGSLPFLETGDRVIAGSGEIIGWADANRATDRASMASDDPKATRDIEQRLDDVAGVHVRRYYYSDALLTNPGAVRPIFSRDLSLLPKIAVTLGWSKIVARMISGMDIGTKQGLESRDVVMGALDWLDRLLADGRRHLSGSTLSRADITAASLLVPFVTPAEHSSYTTLELPNALAKTIAEWQERPVLKWMKRLYAEHRLSDREAS